MEQYSDGSYKSDWTILPTGNNNNQSTFVGLRSLQQSLWSYRLSPFSPIPSLFAHWLSQCSLNSPSVIQPQDVCKCHHPLLGISLSPQLTWLTSFLFQVLTPKKKKKKSLTCPSNLKLHQPCMMLLTPFLFCFPPLHQSLFNILSVLFIYLAYCLSPQPFPA